MYYFALSGAGEPKLIERMIAIPLGDELPSGRVDRFLVSAAATRGDPDLVWKLVLAQRDALFRKLSGFQTQRLLAEVASSSSNPLVADELQAQPEGSQGDIYQVSQAVEQIRFKAGFKGRLVSALDAWIVQHQRHGP
jgi:hypothetical protein